MSGVFKDFLKACVLFFADKKRRRLFLLAILGLWALGEFFVLGLARRTFVFYTISDGNIVVEDRMIKRSASREENITRYVEEAILGPALPDVLPLFPRGTRLLSLLFRDGVVYVNLSEEAAAGCTAPFPEGNQAFVPVVQGRRGVCESFGRGRIAAGRGGGGFQKPQYPVYWH